jgi:hypothetical protein
MSKQSIDNVTLKIKRKRAPVWPFATRSMCEHVIKLLAKDELFREPPPPLSPGGVNNPPFNGG